MESFLQFLFVVCMVTSTVSLVWLTLNVGYFVSQWKGEVHDRKQTKRDLTAMYESVANGNTRTRKRVDELVAALKTTLPPSQGEGADNEEPLKGDDE
jgi:hypothetical protein